jgi:hypothetical protein
VAGEPDVGASRIVGELRKLGLEVAKSTNEGFWMVVGVTYRDAIVIYRVLTSDAQEARQFLSALKERLKEELQQEDILIVEREAETL